MRFAQFGHQVPRRNSRINVPWASNPARVIVPSRLAAPREKSGAREPISRVSVRFCILSSTVSEGEIWNNNGWGTGDGIASAAEASCVNGANGAAKRRAPAKQDQNQVDSLTRSQFLIRKSDIISLRSYETLSDAASRVSTANDVAKSDL